MKILLAGLFVLAFVLAAMTSAQAEPRDARLDARLKNIASIRFNEYRTILNPVGLTRDEQLAGENIPLRPVDQRMTRLLATDPVARELALGTDGRSSLHRPQAADPDPQVRLNLYRARFDGHLGGF